LQNLRKCGLTNEAALSSGKRQLTNLWLAKEDSELQKIAAKKPKLNVIMQDKAWFDSTFPTQNHQSIALECSPLPVSIKSLTPTTLVLFYVVPTPLVLAPCSSPRTIAPPSPILWLKNLNQTLKQLQQNDFWCVGLAGEATQTLPEFAAHKLPAKICVVMGSEGEGLRRMVRENCDELIKIPMTGSVESLNVSVATGIALQALMKV